MVYSLTTDTTSKKVQRGRWMKGTFFPTVGVFAMWCWHSYFNRLIRALRVMQSVSSPHCPRYTVHAGFNWCLSSFIVYLLHFWKSTPDVGEYPDVRCCFLAYTPGVGGGLAAVWETRPVSGLNIATWRHWRTKLRHSTGRPRPKGVPGKRMPGVAAQPTSPCLHVYTTTLL